MNEHTGRGFVGKSSGATSKLQRVGSSFWGSREICCVNELQYVHDALRVVVRAYSSPEPGSTEALQRNCDDGTATACRELGIRLLKGDGVEKNLQRRQVVLRLPVSSRICRVVIR